MGLGPGDWVIVAAYFVAMILIGHVSSRKTKEKPGAEDYFLAGRSQPAITVALSTVASALSVATFVGAPEIAYKADLAYLTTSFGSLIAVFIVAFLFVPRLYLAGTITIYGFIRQRFGEPARIAMSILFLVGRLLASGARLFFASIPLALLCFGTYDPTAGQLVACVAITGAVGTAYTVAGGIRSVMITDTVQVAIMAATLIATISVLAVKIDLPASELFRVLREPTPTTPSKLRVFDLSGDPSSPFTLWAALVGGTMLGMASYGVDHDLAQRMLTASSPLRGGLSLVASQCITVVVIFLFLFVGLLLYVFYQRPDIMGDRFPDDPVVDSKMVYPQFLLHHLPQGCTGLAMAGMFAVAQGSLDSAINAMASSAVADVYWPIRRYFGKDAPPEEAQTASVAQNNGAHSTCGCAIATTPRVAVICMGTLLVLFAVISVFRYDPANDTVLQFALGVMSFAYSGMLGVFVTALFTKRGNAISVIAALIMGLVATAMLQRTVLPKWWGAMTGHPLVLAELWWLPISATLSFIVCVVGNPRAPDKKPEAEVLLLRDLEGNGVGT